MPWFFQFHSEIAILIAFFLGPHRAYIISIEEKTLVVWFFVVPISIWSLVGVVRKEQESEFFWLWFCGAPQVTLGERRGCKVHICLILGDLRNTPKVGLMSYVHFGWLTETICLNTSLVMIWNYWPTHVDHFFWIHTKIYNGDGEI